MSDCSYGESSHGAVKRLEESRNLEVRRNRGSQRELNALESTIANFNWSNEVILTTMTSDWPAACHSTKHQMLLQQFRHLVKFSYYTKIVFNCI